MNKEEYYKRLEKTTEKIKTDRCSEDEIANINRQKLYLAEHYISSLEQENEKLHHYKTLYQSLKKQKEDLKEDISFCLKSIKQEMEMSKDSRTRGEMKSCYEILERWNNE